jgi:uncharacterized protein (DUF1697 family)
MRDLERVFAALKLKGVRTVLASGNVIFEGPGKGGELEGRVRKALLKAFGYDIPVMVRTLPEIEALLKADPFKGHPAGPDVKNYVSFLSGAPKKGVRVPKAPQGETWEVLGVRGREVYVTTRKKKDGHNGFPNDFIEKGLGVTATTRNWDTVAKIVRA